MKRRRLAALVAVVGLLATAHFGWKLTARDAYESAEYEVLIDDGMIQLRKYPDLMLAATSSGSIDGQGDGSFMRLFRYISGGNQQDQKVAMTTPVFMKPQSEEVSGEMAFMIPRQVVTEGVPEPSSEQVEIRQRQGGLFAVIRFNGRMSDALVQSKTAELRQWVNDRGMQMISGLEVAGYDPPWTPGLLRRNEVLIRVQADSDSVATHAE